MFMPYGQFIGWDSINIEALRAIGYLFLCPTGKFSYAIFFSIDIEALRAIGY